MIKREFVGVEHKWGFGFGKIFAIERVADYGVADRVKVYADLVASAGLRFNF